MEKKDIEKEIIKINEEKNAVRETIEENQKNKDLKRKEHIMKQISNMGSQHLRKYK